MSRTLILMLALDHLALVLVTAGNCKPGEYLSSAAWSLEQDHKTLGRIFRPLIDWLFTWVNRDHCYQSWIFQQQLYPKETL